MGSLRNQIEYGPMSATGHLAKNLTNDISLRRVDPGKNLTQEKVNSRGWGLADTVFVSLTMSSSKISQLSITLIDEIIPWRNPFKNEPNCFEQFWAFYTVQLFYCDDSNILFSEK